MEIRELGRKELDWIYKRHMKRDFPRNELRPLSNLKKLIKSGLYDFRTVYEDREFVAYACFLRSELPGVALLDYFAVLPERRGNGAGSKILERLKEEPALFGGILIEVESLHTAPDEEERETRRRRIAFYERSGAHVTRVGGKVFTVDYTVMYLPVNMQLDDTEVLERIREIYGNIFPKILLKSRLHYELLELD